MEAYLQNAVIASVVAVVLSFIIEGGLDYLFSAGWYRNRFEGKQLKWWIAGAVCFGVCFAYPIDLLAIALGNGITVWGQALTAGFLAGGRLKSKTRIIIRT